MFALPSREASSWADRLLPAKANRTSQSENVRRRGYDQAEVSVEAGAATERSMPPITSAGTASFWSEALPGKVDPFIVGAC